MVVCLWGLKNFNTGEWVISCFSSWKIVSLLLPPESHKRRKGRGRERKAPMHLILKLTHATSITKIGKTARYVAKWWCLSVKIHLSDSQMWQRIKKKVSISTGSGVIYHLSSVTLLAWATLVSSCFGNMLGCNEGYLLTN